MDQEKLLELIERSKQGDPEAQNALLQAAEKKIYYHCKKMLKNEEDAEDVTQNVLIDIFNNLSKLREPAAFWGWVNSMTANHCKHLLSRTHKEWQIPEDEDGNSMLDSLEDLDEQYVPDKALDNEETRRMILGLVDDLPPEQRMSVLFYYYDEMSVKQIAEAMDTSEGTVKSRLNYARKSIKSGVEDYERKGIKLYSVSPLVLLAYFLRMDAEATTLSTASAAAIADAVAAATGISLSGTTAAATTGSAASGTAATTATATGSTAAGTATAAAGTAVKAGVSAKLIAGIAAGVIVLGGAATGIVALATRDTAEPEPTPPAVVETVAPTPEPTPEPTPTPFAVEHGFPIVQPHAYEELEGAQVCTIPNAVYFPVTYSATEPEISVSGPDEEGYVTYTITHVTEGDVHFGVPTYQYDAFQYGRWDQNYELCDYYTGQKYPSADVAVSVGNAESIGSSTTVEYNGKQFEVYYTKNVQIIDSYSDGMIRSSEPGLYWEFSWGCAMETTAEVRAPADYDGLIYGINIVDAPVATVEALTGLWEEESDPESGPECWDLDKDDPTHYEFFRLLYTGE